MKQKLWKRLLSYVSDQLIETSSSEYNPELYLLLVKGRYQLVTDKVIYSFEDKYDNFYDLFKLLPLSDLKNCLILGFGLGSIPVMLERNFKLDIEYTGVELDEEIVYLASKYVLDDLKSPMNLLQTDAAAFVQWTNERYDLICVDVFANDEIPKPFKTKAFLNSCNSLLTERGMLVYNSLYLHKEDKRVSDDFFNKVFKKEFPNAKAYHCGNNLMLVSQSHT